MALVRPLAVALGCAVALVAASSAEAAPTWLPGFPISRAGTDNGFGAVSFDANGDATAAWDEGASDLRVSVRPAGGSFSSSQDLDPNAGGIAVGTDSAGNSVIVWGHYDGSHNLIDFSRASAGSAFPAGQPIPGQADDAQLGAPVLAVAPNGEALAAWIDTGNHVDVAVAPPGQGFSAPQIISGRFPTAPAVAVSPSGQALLAYLQHDNSDQNDLVEAAVRGASSATFSTPQTISRAAENASAPHVAISGAGYGIVAWPSEVQLPPSTIQYKPEVVVNPTGSSTFPAVKELAGATGAVGDVIPAVTSDGGARVIWSSGATYPTANTLLAETAPPFGDFGAQQTLSTSLQSDPTLVANQAGDALAAWRDSDGTDDRIRAAAAAPGGPFDSPQYVSPAGLETFYGVSLGIDEQGNGIASWRPIDPNTSQRSVVIAGYDAVGPKLNALSIPGSAVVNRPVTFSVAPTDVWSQVVSTQWNFGDGQMSGARSPLHLFGSPGHFGPSVTATDAVGNSTTAAGAITVAPAPALNKPRISRAKLSRRRFRAARGRGASVATAVGTKVSFTLSQLATMQFHVERCAKLRHHKCRRYKVMKGSFSRGGGQGRNVVRFTGRLRKRPLKPGLYRLDLRASTRGAKSATKRLAFQIVKR